MDGVGGEDEDDVVFGEAVAEEGVGELGDGGFEVVEGEGFGGVGVYKGVFGRRGRSGLEEEGGEGDVGVFGKGEGRS